MEKIKSIILTSALLSLSLPALSAVELTKNNEKLTQCQNEINGTKRLACYDTLLPPSKTVTTTEVTPTSSPGKWQTSVETSPVDDSKNVILVLPGNESFRSNFGEQTTPSLYVACREKKTEVFMDWDVYLGLNETTMLYRIDKQKAVNRTWTISTDTKAVFYRGKPIDFIKKLMGGGKLYAQITPYNESPVSTTFDLAGLSHAIKPLQEACGWK